MLRRTVRDCSCCSSYSRSKSTLSTRKHRDRPKLLRLFAVEKLKNSKFEFLDPFIEALWRLFVLFQAEQKWSEGKNRTCVGPLFVLSYTCVSVLVGEEEGTFVLKADHVPFDEGPFCTCPRLPM